MPRTDLIFACCALILGLLLDSSLTTGLAWAGKAALVCNVAIIILVIVVIVYSTLRNWRMNPTRVVRTIWWAYQQRSVRLHVLYLLFTLLGPVLLVWSVSDGVVVAPLAALGAAFVILPSIISPPALPSPNF